MKEAAEDAGVHVEELEVSSIVVQVEGTLWALIAVIKSMRVQKILVDVEWLCIISDTKAHDLMAD